MITVSLIQTADVDVLKCVFFQLVKTLKEIDWYGIDCNRDQYVEDIEKAFTYLEILNSECELEHSFQCEIKNFITKKSSFCVFSVPEKCTVTYTIEQEVYLATEDNDILLTQNSNKLIK